MPELQKELDVTYADADIQAIGIGVAYPEETLVRYREALEIKFPWLKLDTRLPNPYYNYVYQWYELDERYKMTILMVARDGRILFRERGKEGSGEDSLDFRSIFREIGVQLEKLKR